MKPIWKHLHHPWQALASAMHILQMECSTRAFVHQGDRHFAGDARYNLSAVAQGFENRVDNDAADLLLLERICRSYTKASERQAHISPEFRATPWWEQQRTTSLVPAMQALRSHDLESLKMMYQNFFRNDCSTGLLPVQRMKNHYFGAKITGFYSRLYLIDALYRLDYWRTHTTSRYAVHDLNGPLIGNPYGVVLDGTLIRAGAEYQHACAHNVASLLGSGKAAVAEIGGGFGGMAYYLTRDRPRITYINFDVPESIALASYFLIKAFPGRKIVLYGDDLSPGTIAQADIVLLPVWEILRFAEKSFDLCFSSHAISDLAPAMLNRYLEEIFRTTRDHLVYVGNETAAGLVADFTDGKRMPFTLIETMRSGWDGHITPNVNHVECLYRLDP